jgi:hypothetical protein
LALLQIESEEIQTPQAVNQAIANSPAGSPRRKYLEKVRSHPDRKQEVLDKLYEALYCIIEHRDLPYNKRSDMALGRMLAGAIKRDINKVKSDMDKLQHDPDVRELRNLLGLIVEEAIDKSIS